MSATFVLQPITPEVADGLRAAGGPLYVADSHPGYPCRQCLRDVEIGEELVLVSHDPFVADSPYRSASPIFLHREPCTPGGGTVTAAADLPEQLTRRQLSVRAFDAQAMMIDAAVIDGVQLHETISRFLDDERADHVHVHNATRGCWAVAVRRAG